MADTEQTGSIQDGTLRQRVEQDGEVTTPELVERKSVHSVGDDPTGPDGVAPKKATDEPTVEQAPTEPVKPKRR